MLYKKERRNGEREDKITGILQKRKKASKQALSMQSSE